MTETGDEREVPTLRLVHTEIRARIARLDAYTARIEAKATTMLGFISATALFLATRKPTGSWTVLAFTSLFLAAIAAFAGLIPIRYTDSPEPSPLIRHAASRSEAATLRLMQPSLEVDFSARSRNHSWKAICWYACFAFFAGGVILTILTISLGRQK